MHVVATAGHVDHGKSTLVRALTGMEPDRWEEERRRGLTLDLGFAWTALDGEQVAVVDVPGHERFVPTMLAGVGPVPAVLLVVAADGGWMPQSQEHLDALDALGVRHGLLVVTRADLADPGPALAAARERLAGTTLAVAPHVAVSAATGAGMDDLRGAVLRLVRGLPSPDPGAPVRLWVDRVFSIRGAGTVVTGTLPAGTVAAGDELALPGGRRVVVRGLHALGRPAERVHGVARVAVNLRGAAVDDLGRGDALTTPGSHLEVDTVDVGLTVRDGTTTGAAEGLPATCLLHVGSAQVPVRLRPLGERAARVRLARPLPLRLGDVALLRDPGRHLVLAGARVLDVVPPALTRRGDAARRARELDGWLDRLPGPAEEVARRGLVRRDRLVAAGHDPAAVTAVRGAVDDPVWLLDPAHAARQRELLVAAVRRHAEAAPLETGLPVEAARRRLDLPEPGLVRALTRLPGPPLEVVGGRVRVPGSAAGALPEALAAAVETLRAELADAPWSAPDAGRLRDLGLGPRELAAAVRAGALHRVADGVYLAPEAVREAERPLRALTQPFTLSQARQAWGTSRRVAVPLLASLDAAGRTRRLPDDRRVLTG